MTNKSCKTDIFYIGKYNIFQDKVITLVKTFILHPDRNPLRCLFILFLTKHNIQLTTYIYLNRKLFIFIFRFYATRYACHLTHSCCSLLQCCNYRLYLIEWNFIKIFSHRKKWYYQKNIFPKATYINILVPHIVSEPSGRINSMYQQIWIQNIL